MSNNNANKTEQNKIVNAIFDGKDFGPIKQKVVWVLWADMPKDMATVFKDNYVLQIWRQERSENLDNKNFLYYWNLSVVTNNEDLEEYEDIEIMEPSPAVFWGCGDIEAPATIKVEELAKKVMLEALNAVYIEGDSLPENSEQLITQEEMEKLYELIGPFYLITNPQEAVEADQVWIRGEFGLQSSSYPQR